MRYYANADANGNIIAFYNDEIWDVANIPVTAMEISYEQWQQYSANGGQDFKRDGIVIRQKTQAELDAEAARRPPVPPTTEERLSAAEAAILSLMGL